MEQVIILSPPVRICLDTKKLDQLIDLQGHTEAEAILCRATEELALRLRGCETLYQRRDAAALRKQARSQIAIADQIGLSSFAQCARHVVQSLDQNDPVALAATLARLMRVGEQSLFEIWDLQDLSV